MTFFSHIKKEMMKKETISEKTIDLYILELKRQINRYKPNMDINDTTVQNMLNDNKYLEKTGFKDYAVASKLQMLNAILKFSKYLASQRTLDRYKRVFETQRKIRDERTKENKPTENIKKNWATIKQIQSVLDYYKTFYSFLDSRKNYILNDKQKKELTEYLMVGLYVSDIDKKENAINPPRRLEYANVFVTHDLKIDKKNREYNYLVLSKKNIPLRFVFNDYKTVKYYGQTKVKINPVLKKILKIYFRYVIGYDSPYLFPNSVGGHISKNFLGQKLTKIFRKNRFQRLCCCF